MRFVISILNEYIYFNLSQFAPDRRASEHAWLFPKIPGWSLGRAKENLHMNIFTKFETISLILIVIQWRSYKMKVISDVYL